jgi:RNA polymerase sigma-70 factor (ECF subfamily)
MTPERRKTINEAIERLADGDRSAMPVLVAELWPVLVAFAQRGLWPFPDAEDVAQEVLLAICAKISRFDRARDGVSWAFGIAAFEIMTERKRRLRRRESAPEATLDDRFHEAPSAEEQLIERELLVALEQALGTLGPVDLGLLGRGVGGAGFGYSPPSAAQRKRRQRALDRLRAIWRKLHGEP